MLRATLFFVILAILLNLLGGCIYGGGGYGWGHDDHGHGDIGHNDHH